MGLVNKIIESDLYKKGVQEICKAVNIKTYPKYSDTEIELDIDMLEIANVTIDDLLTLLTGDFNKLISFSVAKIVKFDGVEEVQEYPVGEEPDEDDKDDNIVHQGYSKGFLLAYAVEYFILKHKPETLDNYLKISRIPQAKKYAKELKALYEATQKV
jgi:hypothetical protein